MVTARVHPGESNSSWMMKGLLEYITGNSQMAEVRRSGDIRLSVGQLWNVFLADMTRLLRNHFHSFIELFQIMSFVVYIMYWWIVNVYMYLYLFNCLTNICNSYTQTDCFFSMCSTAIH